MLDRIDMISRVLEEICSKLGEKSEIAMMKVYGSWVKGTETPESDLDICFMLKKRNKNLVKEIDNILFDIGLNNDIVISPVYFFKEDINKKIYEFSPFYNAVMKSGVDLQ